MHDAWSMWSCVSKCPIHGRWQMQKTISMQVLIRDGDGCKRISYLSTQRYGAHNFGSWHWIGQSLGGTAQMSIYRPNTMPTSTLRSTTTFMQASICSSMFTKDMIMQLLRFHARVTMPPKGMWSKPMKLKNISIVVMYLHRKQCGASSNLICMSSILPLSICNTICLINKWCCSMMMMMCRKWQHCHPFLKQWRRNGSK